MTDRPYFSHVLVIPRLRIQNANAISSPLTHGFPAMSAFTGLMWALERKSQAAGLDVQFHAVGVVAHEYEEQVTDDFFAKAFRLTRNPVDKSGDTAAIVEEGRMHMTISLIFAVQGESLGDATETHNIAKQIKQILELMRIAGGSVLPELQAWKRNQPYFVPISTDGVERIELFKKIKMRLLPGFALVERMDLLDERLKQMRELNSNHTRLDAWLSLSRFNWTWQSEADGSEKGEWQHDRKGLGWIVPIPVGYGALGDVHQAGVIANARDDTTEFRFVESLYGIGQWVSPHRLHEVQQMFWYPEYHADMGVYRCCNDFVRTSTSELEYDFD